MENARIIKLGTEVGTSMQPRIATFEEAFGEYSELFGKKARKRRETRRDDRVARKVRRQERKAEKKIARQQRKDDVKASKQDRRSNRKERRQAARIARRAARKEQRQAMRAEQQAARMARRMERKRQKQERKDLEAEREYAREMANAERQRELEEYIPEYETEDEGYDDGGYADDVYDDGSFEDDTTGDYEEYGSDDFDYESDYDWEEDYGYNFEGEAEVDVDENDEEQKMAQSIADKIEWNKKLVEKLFEKGMDEDSDVIILRNDRIAELEEEMRDFVCFDGDYEFDLEDEEEFEDFSGANGRMRTRRRSLKRPIMRRMRKAQMSKVRARRKAGLPSRGRAKMAQVQSRRRPTLVERGIGAEIENNRIVIPATSGADGTNSRCVSLSDNSTATGTGLIGIEGSGDYDYAPTEIQLGADGSKIKKPLSKGAKIGIGLGIGIAAIAILKKTKVL